MRPLLAVLRSERNARLVLAAHLQSCLGTGAAYVVLLIIAHDRFASSWAVTAVLTAGFLPAALLGPVLGAASDRFGRRRCLIGADLVRAAAFAGLLVVDDFVAIVALAFVAGAGNAVFSPALQAAAPGLVAPERLPALVSLLGAARDLGWVLGPPLAALVLAAVGSGPVLALNAATFLVSAAVLTRVRFGPQDRPAEEGGGFSPLSLVRDARAGVRVLRGHSTVMVIVVAGAALTLVGSMQNVAEPLLAMDSLDAGRTGFALLALASTLGTLAGTLSGATASDPAAQRVRLLQGALLSGSGYLASAIAPNLGVAMAGLALAGVGCGWVLVTGTLLVQTLTPPDLLGRAFGLMGALEDGAFLVAMLVSGTVAGAFDARVVLAVAGVGSLLVWMGSARRLGNASASFVVVAPPAAPEAA